MSDINHSDTSNQRCHKSFEPVRMSFGLISTKMKICNDGKCAQCLHDHDGHGSQNCQHRIQVSIRILAHQPKNEDQCAGKQCVATHVSRGNGQPCCQRLRIVFLCPRQSCTGQRSCGMPCHRQRNRKSTGF